MITIIGTSHVSSESVKKVQQAVPKHDIIAVELDVGRARQLLSNNPQPQASLWQLIRQVGFAGALFAKIGRYVEHKIGAAVGTTPGDDMKAAMLAAKEHDKLVSLIDQPIQTTLQRFNNAFTWKVRFKLFKTLFQKAPVKLDVRGEPDEETIKHIVTYLQDTIPELADVLINERNKYMVHKLIELVHNYPEKNILAVVGAGHVPGMKKLLDIQ